MLLIDFNFITFDSPIENYKDEIPAEGERKCIFINGKANNDVKNVHY
jgi:hypothetical protein